MAKQRSTYTGMGSALIEGAGKLYRSQNKPIGVDVSKTTSAVRAGVQALKTKQQNALEAAEREANEAYSVLDNLSFEGILPNMHMGAKDMLAPLAQSIANSRLGANNAQNRDEKNELSLQANMTEGVLKNVVAQLKDLSTNAKTQLDFNRSPDKSAANDPAYISAINKIFSGEAQPQIIDNELGFVIDGETYKYSQLKNISPKATEEYTSYSDTLVTAVGAKTELKQPQIDSYRTKMTGMISPDNIVSLGMDDFGLGRGILGDQFETIQDWEAFVDEDYQGAKKLLADRLTENYITTYNNSAAEYQRLNPPSGGKGKVADPAGTYEGYGKNSQEDIDFANRQWSKAAEAGYTLNELKNAGDADGVLALEEEINKGYPFEFYSSEDSQFKSGGGQKSSWYLKPVRNTKTGDIDMYYKQGSKGEWKLITKEDFDKEMSGKADVGLKNKKPERTAKDFNSPKPLLAPSLQQVKPKQQSEQFPSGFDK